MTAPLSSWKRALDLSFCAIALPVMPLVTFWVALMLCVGSPGPIFLREMAVGPDGRRFYRFKFRTTGGGAQTDRALYGLGWLRATRLDELPKIINVLRGEMSIVNPVPLNSV